MANENQEVQGQEEVKVALEITIKVLENGQIGIDVSNKDTELSVIEDILRKSYDTVHDQRVIELALQAFANKLK